MRTKGGHVDSSVWHLSRLRVYVHRRGLVHQLAPQDRQEVERDPARALAPIGRGPLVSGRALPQHALCCIYSYVSAPRQSTAPQRNLFFSPQLNALLRGGADCEFCERGILFKRWRVRYDVVPPRSYVRPRFQGGANERSGPPTSSRQFPELKIIRPASMKPAGTTEATCGLKDEGSFILGVLLGV